MSDQVSGDQTSAEQTADSATSAPKPEATQAASGDQAGPADASAEGSGDGNAAAGEGEPGAKKRRRRRRRKKKPEGAEGETAAASEAGAKPAEQGDHAATQGAGEGEAAAKGGENDRGPRRGRGRRRDGDGNDGGERGRGRRDDRRDDRDGGGGPRRDRGPGRGRDDRRGGRRDDRGGRGGGDNTLKVSLFAALAGSAQFDDLGDKEVSCRKPGCKNTWTWSREAQVTLKLQGAKIKPPSRLCDEHWAEERALKDQPVECRVRGCSRTWMWSRDAQLKHRAWYEREKAKLEAEQARSAKGEAADASKGDNGKKDGKRGKKGRGKKNRLTDGPPPRLCAVCEARIKLLESIELPCKVHGCGKTWVWTKESQLESWAELPDDVMPVRVVVPVPAEVVGPDQSASTEAPPTESAETPEAATEAATEAGAETTAESVAETAEAKPKPKSESRPPRHPKIKVPRRMCKSCVEFCRNHKDREVECGKPECHRTWTYKIGAQLQDHLAGRNTDPIKLACDFSKKHLDCEFRGQRLEVRTPGSLPAGAEVMPCMVSGCTDSWVYVPGMALDGAGPNGEPIDRMCDAHRVEHGAERRDPRGTGEDEAPAETDGEATGEAAAQESVEETATEANATEETRAEASETEAETGEAAAPATDDQPSSDEPPKPDGE